MSLFKKSIFKLKKKNKTHTHNCVITVYEATFGQMLIEPGFVHMVQWFEKCRKLWSQCRPQWDEPLFNLSEDFFDVIMVSY